MEIRWPEAFTVLLRLLKLISLDWLNFIDIGCLTPYRYYEKFALAVLTMPVMVTCVAGVYHFARKAENIADRCIRMALTAIFLTFPFVSQTTFQGFSCLQLDRDERWLDIDLQIDCDSDGHAVFYYFGVIGVLLYPVGIPVATMWVLVKNRASIKMDGPMRTRYEFLVTDYKRKCEGCRLLCPSRVFTATAQLTCSSFCCADYFWDTLEMARKVVMTGMLMFVNKGSLVQVVVAIVISVIVLMAVAFLQPYASLSANLFKLGAEAALVFTLIVVVLLKIDLSREGIEDPEWWENALGGILVMTNTLLPSAGLCVGLLVFGFDRLEVVVDALDNVIPEDSEADTRAKVKTKKKTKDKAKDKGDKGDADTGDTREVFENPLGGE